jgi:hypothetical protein
MRIQLSNVVNTIIQIRGISTIYDALNLEIWRLRRAHDASV